MMQFSKLESPDLTQRVYDYLLPAMTMDGSLPDTVVEAEMQRAAKSLKLVKTPPAQEIFDFSYVERLTEPSRKNNTAGFRDSRSKPAE